jgi:hypothetical protein
LSDALEKPFIVHQNLNRMVSLAFRFTSVPRHCHLNIGIILQKLQHFRLDYRWGQYCQERELERMESGYDNPPEEVVDEVEHRLDAKPLNVFHCCKICYCTTVGTYCWIVGCFLSVWSKQQNSNKTAVKKTKTGTQKWILVIGGRSVRTYVTKKPKTPPSRSSTCPLAHWHLEAQRSCAKVNKQHWVCEWQCRSEDGKQTNQ